MELVFPPLISSFLKKIFVTCISNCPDSRTFCNYYRGYVAYFLYSDRLAKHLILSKSIIFTFKLNCLMDIF